MPSGCSQVHCGMTPCPWVRWQSIIPSGCWLTHVRKNHAGTVHAAVDVPPNWSGAMSSIPSRWGQVLWWLWWSVQVMNHATHTHSHTRTQNVRGTMRRTDVQRWPSESHHFRASTVIQSAAGAQAITDNYWNFISGECDSVSIRGCSTGA